MRGEKDLEILYDEKGQNLGDDHRYFKITFNPFSLRRLKLLVILRTSMECRVAFVTILLQPVAFANMIDVLIFFALEVIVNTRLGALVVLQLCLATTLRQAFVSQHCVS